MAKFNSFLTAVFFLMCAPAFATEVADPFQQVANQYRAANPKPVMPEAARKFKVQAEFALKGKRYDQAQVLYGKALEIVPWWPEGHYGLALALGEQNKYREATIEMKRYLMLAPEGAEARAAQDRIYEWESVVGPVAGKTFKDCPDCPEMIEIPAGSFAMGSNKGNPDEQPLHNVTITKAFAIGKTEVTQAQWRAVMGANQNPSYFVDCGDDCPVEQVSWEDVQAFIQKLNAKTGKQYRLPSEAEWEYACRGGDQQDYCGSDNADKVSWNGYNSGSFFFKTPHPVATKEPNAFGLYDMSGNVWEWVEDTYHDNYNGAPADGSAWTGSSLRVLRGGSWGYDQPFSRAAARSKFAANYRYYSYGFRLARNLP